MHTEQKINILKLNEPEETISLLTNLIAVAIQVAQSNGFESFKLDTTISKTDNPNEALLAPIQVKKGKTEKLDKFNIPNVFAPIIADPEQAVADGTVFIEKTSDHIVIKDKYPAANTHVLVIPKKDGETILDMPIEKVGALYFQAILTTLQTLNISQARLMVNIYPPNQEVPHVHLHIMSDESAT